MDSSKTEKIHKMIPIILLFISIPAAMVLWAGNLVLTLITPHYDVVPPTRWLSSMLVPLIIAAWGLRKKSISKSGAFLGFFVGFFLTLSNYAFLACLLTFFVSSSKATKFKSKVKQTLESDFKEGGQRNWVQVLCNGGMATLLSIVFIIENGCGEKPIDFVRYYRASCLGIGVLGAFACANGDTWASELGTVLSSGYPRLITSGRKVPKGVNGAVSVSGLIVSLLGGALIGLAYFIAQWYFLDYSLLLRTPSQWPLIPIGAFGGLFGSLIDSLLGATLQYSGVDKKTGVITEQPGKGVQHICGRRILDNHNVNVLSTILTALLLPKIAIVFWPL